MARLRSAPSAPPPATNATQPTKRAALREKTNTARTTRAKAGEKTAKKSTGKDSGDLVKDAAPRRGRPKRGAQMSDELVMAGGLGDRDATVAADADTIHVAQSDAPMTTDELAKSDAPPPPTARPNRRPPRMTRKAVHSEAQSKVLDGLKKRMEETAKGQKAKASVKKSAPEQKATSSDSLPTPAATTRKSAASNLERSEFSLSPSPPPPGKLHSVSAQKRTSMAPPGSAMRVQGTPAVETSILALKNFKRRPRQGSMLAMVQQRTASARPSLANARAQEPEDLSVFDLDHASDDAEDFEPEAEGTPVQLSKAKKPASAKRKSIGKERTATPASAANAKKRNSDGLDSSHSALDALRSKKRKSNLAPANDVPLPAFDNDEFAAPPPEPQASSRHATSEPRQPTSDVQVLNSSPESTPTTEPSSSDKRHSYDERDAAVPSTEERDRLPSPEPPAAVDDEEDDFAIPNGTMAEPVSSPATTPEPEVINATQRTDIYADPLTQISPPRQTRTQDANRPRRKKAAMSTAALQSLLPKRRAKPQPRHKRTEYDISSNDDEDTRLDASNLSEDEDELGGRLRRQAKTTPAKGRKAKSKPQALSSARRSTAARKSAATSTLKSGKAAKTYGRKGAAAMSDKENEEYVGGGEDSELPDTSLEMHEVAKSKELEEAKRKFAEVDEWDMSFESMSYEDHRSSSQGWR